MVCGALAMGAAGPASGLAPASGTITLQATATFSDGTTADRLYEVSSDADSDGDGLNDSGWLRVACDGAVVSAVYYTVKSPRDIATGQSSGKRQHAPFTIIKEWGPSTPMLGKTGAGGGSGGGAVGSMVSWDLGKAKGAKMGYDVKKMEGSRVGKTMAHDSWMTATLKEGSPNLCA